MMNKIKKATVVLAIGASLMGTVAPVVTHAESFDGFEIIDTETFEHDEDGWEVIDWERDLDTSVFDLDDVEDMHDEESYRRAFANNWKKVWGEEDFYRNFPDGVIYGEE